MSFDQQTWTLIVPSLASGAEILLPEEEFHYAIRVLRLRENDVVDVIDGHGVKGKARLIKVSKKEALLHVTSITSFLPSRPSIHLALAFPKTSALEQTITYACMLGVSHIHFFRSEKSQHPNFIKWEKLKRLSQETLRISKGVFEAEIHDRGYLSDFLNSFKEESLTSSNAFLCDESFFYSGEQAYTLSESLNQRKSTNVSHLWCILGAEAGFTQLERLHICKVMNAQKVSLGPHILTVPVAVCAALSSISQAFPSRLIIE